MLYYISCSIFMGQISLAMLWWSTDNLMYIVRLVDMKTKSFLKQILATNEDLIDEVI